jgi:hypothetical protein
MPHAGKKRQKASIPTLPGTADTNAINRAIFAGKVIPYAVGEIAAGRHDRTPFGESTQVGCRNTPDLTCLALSVFGRFNSLIVDFILLFVRFISLFGRVGNYTRMSRNINTLPAWAGSQDHLESGFRSILPSTREPVPVGLLRHQPFCRDRGRAPRAGWARRDEITTSCGFLSIYRRELAVHCAVPVAASQAGAAIPSRAPRP